MAVTTTSSGEGGPIRYAHTCAVISHEGPHTKCHVLRWMAPESIKNCQYSQKSDVFSFGTLLWEIWSRGGIPFPHISEDAEVAHQVMQGLRSGRPARCPECIYKIMESCWRQGPNDRPSISQLKFDLEDAFASLQAALADKDNGDENLCVVCMERDAAIALLPCGHLCACEEDAGLLNLCPICRAPVQTRQRIW